MKVAESKFKVLAGKTPTKSELASWEEGRYVIFLRFCEIFISDKGGELKLGVTKQKWHEVESFLEDGDHPFNEFLYRINFFSFQPQASEKRFYFKLIRLMQTILGYLKDNPSLITPRLKDIIEPNPKFNWCLTTTKVIDTALGPVVVPNKEGIDPRYANTPAPYEARLIDAMTQATDLISKLAGSITDEDIKKMSSKDKLLAFARLLPVFNLSKTIKPGKTVFKQINIHAADRETLEAGLLAFNKDE